MTAAKLQHMVDQAKAFAVRTIFSDYRSNSD